MSKIDEILMNSLESYKKIEEGEPLSEKEKKAILEQTLQKINKEKVVKVSFIKKKWPLVLAATLALSVLGVGAGSILKMQPALRTYFGLEKDTTQTQLVYEGMNVNKECNSGDISVGVSQVIGDRFGFYALLEVKAPLELRDQFDFNEINVNLKGIETLYWDSKVLTQEGKSYVVLNVRTPEKVIGKPIEVELKDLILNDAQKEEVIDKGDWKLNWKLEYTDISKEIEVNQPIELYGGTAQFDKVYVSPLAVYLSVTEKEPFSEHGSYDDQIKVVFKDGMQITSNEENSYNDTTVQGVYFGKIVNPSDIDYIVFRGIKVTVGDK